MIKPTHILLTPGDPCDAGFRIIRIEDIISVAECNGITMGDTGVEYYGSVVRTVQGLDITTKESVLHIWEDMTGISHPEITRRWGH